ncbi:uncharacterized protein LOC6615174 [Drosophila sechellia]|uniref:GM23056 n=1 Tax=Drosophila sechellia TaxID=7238 RepID=B4I6C6_DROSE|nr:uncharacterized protein LOC6615174 [Drosophila sechellia]EDW56332.1 GM23056 [Drosophila sechellia]
MDVKQQLQAQDVDTDLGDVTTSSEALHNQDLNINSSLTTVCSTFPLNLRIESYHQWQPMDIDIGREDILERKLEMESEGMVQPAVSIPLALNATHP